MSEPRAHQTVAPTDLPRPRSAGDAVAPAPKFAPADAFIVFAYAVLARELVLLLEHRPSTKRAATPDQIHQLRVAARRLRVALRLFRRMLPSRHVVRFREDLRWFASSLGDVRDLDVYTDNFKAYVSTVPPEQRGDLSGYELYLRRERADARHRATVTFGDARTTALFEDLARFVAAGPSAGALRRWGSLTVRDGIRASVRVSVGRFRRLGNSVMPRSRATQLHELRIKTKRLRYELEFFAAVYPALQAPAKTCKNLQDLLGTLQDCATATARLRRYANLLGRQAGSPVILPAALVALRRSQLRLARSVRRSFAEQWPGVAAAVDDARNAVA
jgi:CHAD domain-containing protein